MTEDKKLNIYQRINEVRKEIAYIRKDKRVENYMAVTHDAVTAETRDLFIKYGIVIVPNEVESRMLDTGMVSAKGTPSMRFEAKYSVAFVNIDSPDDRLTVEITSHALDFGDKAPGKAISYATKYAILKLLSIETGENEEGRDVVRARKDKKTTSPTDGAFENLDADKQISAQDDADYIVENWNSGDKLASYDAYMSLREGDQEYLTAVWHVLKPHSAVRNGLKKMYQESQNGKA